MAQKVDVLRIIKEDILRIMGETKRARISLSSIKEEINASDFYISKAISALEDESLIKSEKDFIKITEKGQKKAENIAKRHLSIENYFRKTRSIDKAHRVTDILEHYISEEVANNITELSTLKGSGVPLIKLEINKECIIADIMLEDSKLLERIISMGIFPGERIKVMSETSNAVIVKVKGKKIALDREIAKGVMVLRREKL